MPEEEKPRFILIVIALVATLLVHRLRQWSEAHVQPIGGRFFSPRGFGAE
jgi:hypothetical protein